MEILSRQHQLAVDSPIVPLTPAANAVTVNLAKGNKFEMTLATGVATTISLSNEVAGQGFSLLLNQDGTGSCSVTWWDGILWANSTVPTLTSAAGGLDMLSFVVKSPGVYLGMFVPNFG